MPWYLKFQRYEEKNGKTTAVFKINKFWALYQKLSGKE